MVIKMVILETERLLVREFIFEDADLLFRYSQEEKVKKELPDEVLASPESASDKIKFFQSQYENGDILVYAIELKEINRLIGHISLSPITEGVEIGYSVASDYQNKGYISEIIKPFSDWAMETLKINKLYGIVKKSNNASVKVLEKAGYTLINEENRDFFGKHFTMRTYVIIKNSI